VLPTEEIMQKVKELPDAIRSNRFLVFAMSLVLNTEEYERVYGDYVVDGSGDKKVDFFYLDRESGRAVIAQGFETPNWQVGPDEHKEPPADKASDLNTALAWLLDSDLSAIPSEAVRASAQELRDALESGDINTVVLYYVHNLMACANVDKELATVRNNLAGRLGRFQNEGISLVAEARQLSVDAVLALYKSRYSSIRIEDEVRLLIDGPETSVLGPKWKAHCISVPGPELARLVETYGDELYSANIRDYLGVRSSRQNINKKIEETALKDAKDFWVFNNGVTMVTRSAKVEQDHVRCEGIAVVNGAQTLGSLHRASKAGPVDEVKVLVRIVESANEQLIQNIIRYNNTQNPIKPWELRVLDPVQSRIEDEFAKIGIGYHYRRGLDRRSSTGVHSDKLGTWLNSFYGDPITSHRNSPELFDNDKVYRQLFPEEFNVRHLLLVYRLGEAIAATKDEYRQKVETGETGDEATIYSYFRYGAFSHVALYLCAEVLGALFGGGQELRRRLVLDKEPLGDRDAAVGHLKSLVKWTLAPVPTELADRDAFQAFRSMDEVKKIAASLRTTVGQWRARDKLREELDSMREGISTS